MVVRLLPLADGELQYRVRSELDGLDRVVLERQIRLVEKAIGTTGGASPRAPNQAAPVGLPLDATDAAMWLRLPSGACCSWAMVASDQSQSSTSRTYQHFFALLSTAG